jgi:hypothetical protein
MEGSSGCFQFTRFRNRVVSGKRIYKLHATCLFESSDLKLNVYRHAHNTQKIVGNYKTL